MLITFVIISWTLSIIFLFLKHPISLGAIIFLQTIIASLILGFTNLDYWFSYILFLVMIGGMLILFIYMTSIASNEKFKFSNKLLVLTFSFIALAFSVYVLDDFFYSTEMYNYEFINQSDIKISNNSLNKYYNYPNFMVMIILMSYLLITLIAVVKISWSKSGPLRQMK